MLPFLAPKKAAGIIMMKRKPEGNAEAVKEEGMADPACLACAEDLISAVHAKDAEGVAMALESAFQVLGAMPDESLDLDGEVK